jgi:hypothetical protein
MIAPTAMPILVMTEIVGKKNCAMASTAAIRLITTPGHSRIAGHRWVSRPAGLELCATLGTAGGVDLCATVGTAAPFPGARCRPKVAAGRFFLRLLATNVVSTTSAPRAPSPLRRVRSSPSRVHSGRVFHERSTDIKSTAAPTAGHQVEI